MAICENEGKVDILKFQRMFLIISHDNVFLIRKKAKMNKVNKDDCTIVAVNNLISTSLNTFSYLEDLSTLKKVAESMNGKVPIVRIERLSASSLSSDNSVITAKTQVEKNVTNSFSNDFNISSSFSTTNNENFIIASNVEFNKDISGNNNVLNNKDISFNENLQQKMVDQKHNSCKNSHNNSIIIAGSIMKQEQELCLTSGNICSMNKNSLVDSSHNSIKVNATTENDCAINLHKNISINIDSNNIYNFSASSSINKEVTEKANLYSNTTIYIADKPEHENNQSDHVISSNSQNPKSFSNNSVGLISIFKETNIEDISKNDSEILAKYAESLMHHSFINESYTSNLKSDINEYVGDCVVTKNNGDPNRNKYFVNTEASPIMPLDSDFHKKECSEIQIEFENGQNNNDASSYSKAEEGFYEKCDNSLPYITENSINEILNKDLEEVTEYNNNIMQNSLTNEFSISNVKLAEDELINIMATSVMPLNIDCNNIGYSNKQINFKNSQSNNNVLLKSKTTKGFFKNSDKSKPNFKGICNGKTEKLQIYTGKIENSLVQSCSRLNIESTLNEGCQREVNTSVEVGFKHSPNNVHNNQDTLLNLKNKRSFNNLPKDIFKLTNFDTALKENSSCVNADIDHSKSSKPIIIDDKRVSLTLRQGLFNERKSNKLSEIAICNKENINTSFSLQNNKSLNCSITSEDIDRDLFSKSTSSAINIKLKTNVDYTNITEKNNSTYNVVHDNIILPSNCDDTYNITQNDCNVDAELFHPEIINDSKNFAPQVVSSFIEEQEKMDNKNESFSVCYDEPNIDKDESYKPDDNSLSENSDNSDDLEKETRELLNSSLQLLDITKDHNFTNIPTCNVKDMNISYSESKKRKSFMCLYCKKLLTNLPRHFTEKHKNEEEVKNFSVLPKGNSERKKILDLLRKKGNFLYNTNSEFNKGNLIVARRPSKKLKRSATDFTACVKCNGFFSKNNIRHHFKQCLVNYNTNKQRTIKILGRSIMCQIHHTANFSLKRIVFPVMREDAVTKRIRNDELIIAYGNKMCIKYRLPHQHDMIRARMRLLGRYLITLSEVDNSIVDFSSIYHPNRFDNSILAVHKLAEYEEDTCTYKIPSIASSLGTLLKLVGRILRSTYIKRQDPIKQKEVEDYLKLFEDEYGISVNKTVQETMIRRNRQKKVILPAMKDIKQFNMYLKDERRKAYEDLKTNKFSMSSWLSLAEYTLISIQMFNRRRAGELERILIDDLSNQEKMPNKSDAHKNLSKYARIFIRGKLGRNVPLLLNDEILKYIDLILRYRSTAGVSKKNPYIFGIPSMDERRHKYLKACALMRKFSIASGIQFPTLMRGTILRKHIATVCITLDISENQISDLANFMGHHEKIHKSHYRQSIASREIAVAQLLQFAQGEEDEDEVNSEESEKEVDICEIQNSTAAFNIQRNETYLKIRQGNNADLVKDTAKNNMQYVKGKQCGIKTKSMKRKVAFKENYNIDSDDEGNLQNDVREQNKKIRFETKKLTDFKNKFGEKMKERNISKRRANTPTSNEEDDLEEILSKNKKQNKKKRFETKKLTDFKNKFGEKMKERNISKRRRANTPTSNEEDDLEEILSKNKKQNNNETNIRRQTTRRKWTDEEKQAVLQAFKTQIDYKKLPSFTEINNLNPLLKMIISMLSYIFINCNGTKEVRNNLKIYQYSKKIVHSIFFLAQMGSINSIQYTHVKTMLINSNIKKFYLFAGKTNSALKINENRGILTYNEFDFII
ncbi:MATH and LRR domain-containing protein PFE0570w-like [Prorops nasuta]|uniref:MATH and LRR domain-containing protein PFE0570w-like n=1 Tax=Prorops nasuta TaxID=863751 RepID=UPI0034CD0F7D